MNLEFVTLSDQGEVRFRASAKRLRNTLYIAAEGCLKRTKSHLIRVEIVSNIGTIFSLRKDFL